MTDAETIEQLKAQNQTQEAAIKRLWVDRQKKIKRIQIQQWIIDKQNEGQPPTRKQQIMAQAEKVFDNGNP